MATSFLASITVVLVGTLLVARKEGQPVPLLDLVFSTSTLAAAVALAMLVLGQFRTRLVGSLEQTRLAEEQSRFEATHDFLTGLPNRALLEQRLGEWLSSIKNDVADRRLDHEILKTTPNSDSTLAVLFLDLDRFKYVNDSLGHHIGDELLQVVAKRISSCIRPQEGDLLSRLGGDEFVLVICSPQPETAVAHKATRP
jgi:diguanylate cyclase (GGDEF)-like protein